MHQTEGVMRVWIENQKVKEAIEKKEKEKKQDIKKRKQQNLRVNSYSKNFNSQGKVDNDEFYERNKRKSSAKRERKLIDDDDDEYSWDSDFD